MLLYSDHIFFHFFLFKNSKISEIIKNMLLNSYITINNFNLCIAEEPVLDPCNPSPCGANALCRDGSCTCLPEFQGDPYSGCRPECVMNTDCARDRACIRNKCIDPCIGTCGQNAQCQTINHIPMCSCPAGMSGNAFVSCSPVQGTIC